ncbi:MAG: hypothetical protein QOI64_752 [Solirubrobacteraceae bacterium]|nr:hypothetical protein [Solirubrobacteraceae bacterium]
MPDTDTTRELDPIVAVVVDRRRSEYLLARTTILPALHHWGVPHTVLDLADGSVAERLGRAGVVLLAQEYLGEPLAAELPALVEHTRAGAGLVNLDHALHTYPRGYLEAIGASRDPVEISVEAAIVADTAHAITHGCEPGYAPRLKQPLPSVRAGVALDDALLVDDDGEALVAAGALGSGRIVQWSLSPKLWNERYLGFAHGIDGLVWRSIVWSGPKPFGLNAMPPYVRFRFDDCNGHWQEPADLAFAEVLAGRGHVPSICFCLRALTDDGAAHAAALQRAGRIDLAPHTLAPATSFFYGDADGEYSPERFRDLFGELDDAQRRWGVEWSQILSDHEHEWSRHAVPYLRERGIRFKMNILLPGERWTDPHIDWRPAPFGSMSYALDHLPGDLSDFFVVFNHHHSFDSARVYQDHEHFIYHRPGGFGRQKWDFLNGLVRGPDARAKDLAAVVDRIVEHTRLGLDALFFGGSISHSHFTRHLGTGEWEEILDRADARLAGVEQIPVSYDEIATYAEAKAGTRLTGARRDGDRLRLELEGSSARSLSLSVFDEQDGALVRREAPVEPFEGGSVTDVELTAA